jgi:CelD/BcsL family acetyltransferase involved in cellulose biosynthesis
MSIELIQSTSDFLALKEDWNNLLSSSASHVPFLRHEFLASWWSTLGGGEWDQGSLAILVDRDPDGSLAAVAPLFINENRVMFLGSYEISDYLDLIAPPGKLASFIPALFTYLGEDNFPAWQKLDLYNLREDSPSLPLLKEGANQLGYKITQEVIQPAPYLHLPESWQDYLDSLKDRYRREIEKKITNADQYFLPVAWYIVEEEDSLDDELDAFLKLMANHPQKKVFLTDKMIDHMKISAQEGFREGWLQLAFLQVGDIKAAGYLNFDFNDQIWVYNSGIDPLFENLSPGWVLLGKIIEWAIDHGRVGLDFMRGDETYKYQLGGVEMKVLRLEIQK